MKCTIPALGGVLFVTTAASAGVTIDNAYTSSSGSGNYHADLNGSFNVFDTQNALGVATSASGNSSTNGGGWSDGAYAVFSATNTSTVTNGTQYGWSGSMSARVENLTWNEFMPGDGVGSTTSSTVFFTLDEATDVSMAMSWLVSVDTDTTTGLSGQFGIFFKHLTGQYAGQYEEITTVGGSAGSESLSYNTTLGAGEYKFFFQMNNSAYSSATSGNSESNLTFQASMNFGGGGGGAVPGLGALAPLAAAGLARRRRR